MLSLQACRHSSLDPVKTTPTVLASQVPGALHRSQSASALRQPVPLDAMQSVSGSSDGQLLYSRQRRVSENNIYGKVIMTYLLNL